MIGVDIDVGITINAKGDLLDHVVIDSNGLID